MNDLSDFYTWTTKERRGPVSLKGDVPGHEFHGNQYTEGGGGGDAESESGGGSEYKSPDEFRGAENPKVAKTLSEADKHLQQAKKHASEISQEKRREFSYIQSANHARDAEAIISSGTHSAPMGKHGVMQDQADKALHWAKESNRLLEFVSK